MNYMIRKENAQSKCDQLQLKISTPKTIKILCTSIKLAWFKWKSRD